MNTNKTTLISICGLLLFVFPACENTSEDPMDPWNTDPSALTAEEVQDRIREATPVFANEVVASNDEDLYQEFFDDEGQPLPCQEDYMNYGALSNPFCAVNGVRAVDPNNFQSAQDVFIVQQSVTLTWTDQRVRNWEGNDFVVFENPFEVFATQGNVYAEPAIIELSLDGENWATFPHKLATILENNVGTLANVHRENAAQALDQRIAVEEHIAIFEDDDPTNDPQDTTLEVLQTELAELDETFTLQTQLYDSLVQNPVNWIGFAGLKPVLLHAEINPVDPFDVVAAGGDHFDLDALPANSGEASQMREEGFVLPEEQDETAFEIREQGFRYIRFINAVTRTNPATNTQFPGSSFCGGVIVVNTPDGDQYLPDFGGECTSAGQNPDIDGVYARYLSSDDVEE